MESDEILMLSYGMGIYRFISHSNLSLETETLKSLSIVDLLKIDDDRYIGISSVGKLPSHMEIAIQETSEFREDQASVIKNGSRKMKDRFYELYKVSVVG